MKTKITNQLTKLRLKSKKLNQNLFRLVLTLFTIISSFSYANAVSNQTITIRLTDENGNALANYPSNASRMTWQYRCGGSWVNGSSSGQQTDGNGEFDIAINCSSNNWDGRLTITLFNTSQELTFSSNPLIFTTAKVNVNIKNSCTGLVTSPGSDIQINYSGWPSVGNTNGSGTVSWQAFAGRNQSIRLGSFNRVNSVSKSFTVASGVNEIDYLTSELNIFGATSRYPNTNSSNAFSTPSEFLQGTYPIHLYTGTGSNTVYRGIHNIVVSGCETNYYPLLSSNSGVTITEHQGLYDENGIQVSNDALDRTWQVRPSSNLTNVSLTFQWDGSFELNGFDESEMGVYTRTTGVTGSGLWTLVNTGSASTVTGSVNSFTVTGLTLNSGTNYYFGLTNSPLTPLPVKLLSFDAALVNNNDIKVNWVTENEENSLGFYVQTSTNGKNWTNSGFVNSKSIDGNSKSQLSYSSMVKTLGLNTDVVFIKLNQVDRDNKFYSSNILSVNLSNKSILNDVVKISPNPVNDILNVNINASASDEVNVQLFDIFGRALSNIPYSNNQIDMSALPSGIYLLKVNINGVILSERIIK